MFGFLGLPSLGEIVEAIAKDFFGALAHALIPEWLSHATVASIQYLVALPDPASWGHVSQLQGDMSFLGVSLLPAVFAASAVRYWMVGLTGGSHPTVAVGRAVWVMFLLVGYRWMVTETVDGANTMTHAVLGFPVVAHGLSRIILVLFGGALLTGTGSVLGALLVIVGVILAVALFAVQVLVTLILALLVVAGPPLVALSVVPELSHLARAWAHLLLAVCLVPLAWAVLFATAGALALDATSFTGGAAGLPGHLEAAFAALATFVLALRLPLLLLGQARHLFAAGALSGGRARAGERAQGSSLPGVERVRAAHARLRSVAFEGVPSMGRSVGQAAGALGAPKGGAVGVARRGLARVGLRSGMISAGTAGALAGGAVSTRRAGSRAAETAAGGGRRGLRRRLGDAGAILAGAPRQARAAMRSATRDGGRPAAPGRSGRRAGRRRAARAGGGSGPAAASPRARAAGDRPAKAGRRARKTRPAGARAQSTGGGSTAASSSGQPGKRRRSPRVRPVPAGGGPAGAGKTQSAKPGRPDGGVSPVRRQAAQAQRQARADAPRPAAGSGERQAPPQGRRSRKTGRQAGRADIGRDADRAGGGGGVRRVPPPASGGRRGVRRWVSRKSRPGGGS